MRYLALGDSISIDLYTRVADGGAASQLARLLSASDFENRTFDGATSEGVLLRDFGGEALRPADVTTITIGGNDLLGASFTRALGDRAQGQVALAKLLGNLDRIGEHLRALGGRVIVNTIYDPTDRDDSKAPQLGLPASARAALVLVNAHLTRLAETNGFLLCDLEALFHGHGFWSPDSWLVMHIEPNLAGATAIARAWRALL